MGHILSTHHEAYMSESQVILHNDYKKNTSDEGQKQNGKCGRYVELSWLQREPGSGRIEKPEKPCTRIYTKCKTMFCEGLQAMPSITVLHSSNPNSVPNDFANMRDPVKDIGHCLCA